MMCVGLDLASVRAGAFQSEKFVGDGAPNAPAQWNVRLPKRGNADKSSLKGRKRDGVPHALDDTPGGGISQPIDLF
jgi:hypothetical protein